MVELARGDCMSLRVQHLPCRPGFLGVELQFDHLDFDPLGPALNALNRTMAAALPLKPLLDTVSAVAQIVKCIQAIPEAIITLDPGKLVECMKELVQKMIKVLAILPPFSCFQLVAGLVCMLADAINGINTLLRAVQYTLREGEAAFMKNLTLNDADLRRIIACNNANSIAQLSQLAAVFALLEAVLMTVNTFLELTGQKPIGLPTSLPYSSADQLDIVIDALDVAYATLLAVLRVIPSGLSMVQT